MTFFRNMTLDGTVEIGLEGQKADIIHEMGLPDHYVHNIFDLGMISGHDGFLMFALTTELEKRIRREIGRDSLEFQRIRAKHENYHNKRLGLSQRMQDIAVVWKKSLENSPLIERSEIREWVKKANEIFDEIRRNDATIYESLMTESIAFGVEFPSMEEINAGARTTQSAVKIRQSVKSKLVEIIFYLTMLFIVIYLLSQN